MTIMKNKQLFGLVDGLWSTRDALIWKEQEIAARWITSNLFAKTLPLLSDLNSKVNGMDTETHETRLKLVRAARQNGIRVSAVMPPALIVQKMEAKEEGLGYTTAIEQNGGVVGIASKAREIQDLIQSVEKQLETETSQIDFEDLKKKEGIFKRIRLAIDGISYSISGGLILGGIVNATADSIGWLGISLTGIVIFLGATSLRDSINVKKGVIVKELKESIEGIQDTLSKLRQRLAQITDLTSDLTTWKQN